MAGTSIRTLSRFKGLNNVEDPMRGPVADSRGNKDSWEWQSVADNVDITDTESIIARNGYTPFVAGTAITSSYSTFDHKRLYIIDSGVLNLINKDGTSTPLATGLNKTTYWAELNDIVYVSCGSEKLQLMPDNAVFKWGVDAPQTPTVRNATGSLFSGTYQICLTYTDAMGREGGASPSAYVQSTGGVSITDIPALAEYTTNVYMTEADGSVFYLVATLSTQTAYTHSTQAYGRELTTQFLDAPPVSGTYIAVLGANIYHAEYMPDADQSVIWISQPMTYHLFNLNADYFVVPGEITQMYGSDTGLVIATHTSIYVYNNDNIERVAEYGAVPGQHADMGADKKVYFWTKQGLCRAMPFENMTDSKVSVAPGTYAGGGVVNADGFVKYIAVIKQGGNAYNRR